MITEGQGMQIVEKLVAVLLADVKIMASSWKLVEPHMQLELKRKWSQVIVEEFKKLGKIVTTTVSSRPHIGEVIADTLHPKSDGTKTWHGPGTDKTEKPFPTDDGSIPSESMNPEESTKTVPWPGSTVDGKEYPLPNETGLTAEEQKAADKANAKEQAWEDREETKEDERKERMKEDREASKAQPGKAKR
jgi:hypothetical protein